MVFLYTILDSFLNSKVGLFLNCINTAVTQHFIRAARPFHSFNHKYYMCPGQFPVAVYLNDIS